MKKYTIFLLSFSPSDRRVVVHYWRENKWSLDSVNHGVEMTVTEALKLGHQAAATRNNIEVYVASELDTIDEEIVATIRSRE